MSNKLQLSANRLFLTVILAFAALVVILQARPTFAQTSQLSGAVTIVSTQPATMTDEEVDPEMLLDQVLPTEGAVMVDPSFPIDEEMMVDPQIAVDLDMKIAPFPYVDHYQIAAETIGIDLETLWSEWDQGKSLAEIAQAHNVSADVVVAAIVKAENQLIDQSVVDGMLTEQEAADWRADVLENVNDTVNYHYIAYPDFYAIAAQLIGVDVTELYNLQGQSIAQYVAAHGVDKATLTQALTDAMNLYIDTQVEYGQLSAEEAQEQRNYVADNIDWTINWVYVAYPDSYQIVADLLGITTDELWTAWQNGQSLTELAEANGVAKQTLVDALTVAFNSYYDEMVATGQLSAEEANNYRATIAAEVERTISTHNIAYPDPYQTSADMLGISIDELFNQLNEGTTIAQLAEQHGIATQTIIDALVAAENQYIDAMLADGQITAEDAASWRENVVESQTNLVNESWNVEPMQFDIR